MGTVKASASANPIRSVLVVGGGSAGWMAAAWLRHAFRDGSLAIELVESEEIGTVGVGEATIPALKRFNRGIGLDEAQFVRDTHATFKLGIEFVNWGRQGHRYFHPFGGFGKDFDSLPLEQYWIKLWLQGKAPSLDDLATANTAAARGRFSLPLKGNANVRSRWDYAFHFDAGLYGVQLRKWAEARGVVRHEGRIVDVTQDGESGHVRSVKLSDGRELSADLFVDCSGFRGLLIEQTLQSGFEDWSHWLPCDRALAMPTESAPGNPTPFTRSTAQESGWQWRIPLQNRIGNGHVFSSAFTSEERAAELLLETVDTKPLAEPRLLKFKAGQRKSPWVKNVVSLGLAAGFLEPLESTSIHLVQSAVKRLVTYFPTRDFNPLAIDEYNRATRVEWEGIRDFIVLHYCANERTDTEFWKYCSAMEVPESLQRVIDHFRTAGRFGNPPQNLFTKSSWFAVFMGQFVEPKAYHPLVDSRPGVDAAAHFATIANWVDRTVDNMPEHGEFIARNCKAPMTA
jgi:tryptophan halogenase